MVAPEDFLLTKEEIDAKYPGGSPDYPSHHRTCGCSGCHASWMEWRGGHAAVQVVRPLIQRLEGQVEHKDEALRAAVKQMGEFQAKYLDAESAIGAARMFATSAKEDATAVCLALRNGHADPKAPRGHVIPENAERTLYFVRQVLSAVGATAEERHETIRKLLDGHKGA